MQEVAHIGESGHPPASGGGHTIGDKTLKTMIMAQQSESQGLMDWLEAMLWNGHMVELPCICEIVIRLTFRKLKFSIHPDKVSEPMRPAATVFYNKLKNGSSGT